MHLLAWIPLLPLFGFLINGTWYAATQPKTGARAASATVTGVIASVAIFGAFVCSLTLFLNLSHLPMESRVIEQNLFEWFRVGTLSVQFTFKLDALSSLFALVITGVGTLIHIYSIGYMAHDAAPGKFFAYLNLFCFAMLVLVLGSSLPVLFLGWEGVGLCSYLLIGYWYEDEEKAMAGKKAFIVNRIGDFGFLLGMFLLFSTFGTLDFSEIHSKVIEAHGGFGPEQLTAITAACILLFVGCTGKSAQIPLYIWLPDAMAGPTPVSALIHAATMVTSGVYLLSRLSFLFSLSPTSLQLIAWIGALTAFFAATIAVTQRDIKKVLAYSTVSQLGYMFLGCGVGAFSAGVFHVITHAFFKALLFLGAGSVIHGMHEEQDIFKMGGLKKYMPKTAFVFAVAWLAICGIPPFSGFFSKDEILWQSFSSHGGSVWLWAIGALTAILTAGYMTRLFSLTFWGELRAKHHGEAHGNGHDHKPHESPAIMMFPLYILAALSAVGGFLGVPHHSWIEQWLDPVVHEQELNSSVAPSMEWILMLVSVLGAVVAMVCVSRFYRDLKKADRVRQAWPRLYAVLLKKWGIDEFYEAAVVRPIFKTSQNLWRGFDIAIIDRIVLGFGRGAQWTGQTLRIVQTGSVQAYAIIFLIGLLLSVGYLIYGLV